MKKIVSTTLIISLLTSTLTPLTFAADMGYGGAAAQIPAVKAGTTTDPRSAANVGVRADDPRVVSDKGATVDPRSAANAAGETNPIKTMIDGLTKKGITNLSPYEVIQAFVFISAYQAGVTSLDAAAGRATMDMALDKYAPNLSIRTTTKSPEGVDQQTYFSDTINAWAKKFSQEYDKVYAFVKDYMSTVRPATNVGNTTRPDANNNTADASKAVCDNVYNRLMAEYEALIKANAPYEKIKDIKEKIAAAQSNKSCDDMAKAIATTAATPVDAIKQQSQKVEELKKGINFGSRVPNVIPNNIVPGYCEANYVSNLRDQLANNDVEKLEEIKTALQDAVTDAGIENNSIKNSVLNLASQEVAEVQSQKVLEQGLANKEQITFNNFVRNLMLVVDSIINTRAVNYIAEQVKNPQRFIDMFQTLSVSYSSFQEFIAAGDLVYTWMPQDNAFTTQKNTEQGIVFLFPAVADAITNNAKLTINAIKTRVFEVKQQSYLSTVYKGELTLEQFAQEVRNNGNWFAVNLYPEKLPYALVQTLKENDKYRNNNDGTVNFFVAEANGQRKAFADYNMTKWMTPGRYVDQRNNVYTVQSNGDVEQTYQTDSPERIVGRFDIDGRQLLGVDLRIGYNESIKYTDDEGIQPTTIDARLYIADYLITAKWSRTNRGSTWSMDATIKIEGPSICNFTLVGSLTYADNGTNGMPDMDNPQTLDAASFVLSYNNNELILTADDVEQMMTTAVEQISMSEKQELSPEQIITIINQYVQGLYKYSNQTLAQLQASIDGWVNVIYPDSTQESVVSIIQNNMALLRMDNIMTIMQLFGLQSEEDSGETQEAQPEQEAVDNNKLYATARGYDTANQPNRLYIAYAFDDTQSVNDINPDRVYAYVTYADGTYGEYDLMYETNYYVIESDKVINQDDQPGVQGRTDGMITSSIIYAQYTYNGNTYRDKQVIKNQVEQPIVDTNIDDYGYGTSAVNTDIQAVYTTNTIVQNDLIAVNLQKTLGDGSMQGFTDKDGVVTVYKTYGENCNVEPCASDAGEALVYDRDNNEWFTLNGVDITDPNLWYVSIVASYTVQGVIYESQMGIYKK